MTFLVVALVCGLVGAIVADHRSGEVLGGFLIGFVLGPLGVLIAAVKKPSQKQLDKMREKEGLRKCPFCAEHVKPEAVMCRYCHSELRGGETETPHPTATGAPVSATTAPHKPAAGWYPSPGSASGSGHLRYWDGLAWTSHVRELQPQVAASV